jgi:hypothetical protein
MLMINHVVECANITHRLGREWEEMEESGKIMGRERVESG